MLTRWSTLCVLTIALSAATAAAAGPKPIPPAAIHQCSADPSTFAVSGVETPKENPERTAYLGDWVTIYVCHLDEFRLEADKEQKDVTLFINGVDSGVRPDKVDLDGGSMTYPLSRTEKNKPLWAPLLYNPVFQRDESIFLSVGKTGERSLPRLPQANMHITFDKIYVDGWSWLWVFFLAAVVIVCVLYARNSDMLRDGRRPAKDRPQTYSLARVQMAWWFILVLVAYVLIWMVTGDRDTIPVSLLGLMGISAATAIAAVAITPRAEERVIAAREALDQRRIGVVAKMKALDEAIAASTDPAVQAELTKRKDELQVELGDIALQASRITTDSPSKNLWHDLVTDNRGAVTLDRFQIVVWTLVLGGLFLTAVVWDLTMPEFNGTLLALMGISSGTYIGFKLPQKS